MAAVRRGYQRALLVPSPQVTAPLHPPDYGCLSSLVLPANTVGWQARGQPAKGNSIMIWCRFTCVTPAFAPRFLCHPALQLEALWRGYEGLEMSGSNKQLARRLLDEWRPKYQAGVGWWYCSQ